jgi:hypothetical protein
VIFDLNKAVCSEVSLYGWDEAVSFSRGWLRTRRFDWPLSHPFTHRQLGGAVIRWYANAVSHIGVGPERES